MTNFTGTPGDDNLVGTSGNDNFVVTQGGNDTIEGNDGDDTINFGATFTAADTVDGGTGTDTLVLAGDYSLGVTFAATTMVNVEKIVLRAGNSYTLTTVDQTVAAGTSLLVNGQALGAADKLIFDGRAETDGAFHFIGGAGNDHLIGSTGADNFDLTQGGDDFAQGGQGADVFNLGAAFSPPDQIKGGDGQDTVILSGNYSTEMDLAPTTLVSVETLKLGAGGSYNFVLNDANTVAGAQLFVNGTALGAGDTMRIDGHFETDGNLRMDGGAGNDTLIGGAGNNRLTGNGGNDTINVTGGNNTVDGSAGDDVVNLNIANPGTNVIGGGDGNDTFNLSAINFSTGGTSISGGNGDDIVNVMQAFPKVGAGGVDGGAGNDTVNLLSSGVDLFGANSLISVETINVNTTNGGVAMIFTDNSDIPGSGALNININANFTTNISPTVSVQAQALTAGSLNITDNGGDTIQLLNGGGDDVVTMNAAWKSGNPGNNDNDSADGGGGYDTLVIASVSRLDAHGANYFNFEELDLTNHAKWFNIDSNVSAGNILKVVVDDSQFFGSFELDGSFDIVAGQFGSAVGSANADTLTATAFHANLDGGGGDDTITSQLGVTQMTGGAGADHIIASGVRADTFGYHAVTDSTSTTYDTIENFNPLLTTAAEFLTGTVTAVDPEVTSGHLSAATFDSDLATAVNASHLGIHQAVLFTPTTGDLAGSTFLIVDANGALGYQSGQDYVIKLVNATHLTSLDTTDFGPTV